MKKARATTDLQAVVENCLPTLSVLWLAIDTYGSAENVEALREVIKHLQDALPSRCPTTAGPLEFIVKAAFRVARSASGAFALDQP